MSHFIHPELAAMLQSALPHASTTHQDGLVFRCASQLNGEPIRIVVQPSGNNKKIGNMVQVWIMPEAVKPTSAAKTGHQEAVCGKCWHHMNGTCYVNLASANSTWEAVNRGNYREVAVDREGLAALAKLLDGRFVRVGAWGDPAAMPWELMAHIVDNAAGWTAYTHQFNHPRFDMRFAAVCMVSCETAKQAERLQRSGYRTFRVKVEGMPVEPNEIHCPAQTHNITCDLCRLCDGQQAQRGTANVTVNVHGLDFKGKRFAKRFASLEAIAVINL